MELVSVLSVLPIPPFIYLLFVRGDCKKKPIAPRFLFPPKSKNSSEIIMGLTMLRG